MKKFMTIVLAAALVFAFAGQASAALETSGEYRARYWNLTGFNQAGEAAGTAQDNFDFFDQRLRLNMNWKVSDAVTVAARADILENLWQTNGNNAVNGAGDAAKEIDFDQAYAAVAVGPGTLTVGKQDVSWGPGIYAKADNRYRVKYGGKFGGVSASAAWDTLVENLDSKTLGDDNGFSAGVVMPVGGFNLGVLALARMNENDATSETTLYGVDVYTTGAIGPAKLSAEVTYVAGEKNNDTAKDVDLSGLLAYVGATIPAGPVAIGAELAYASGDDPGTKSENEGAIFFDYQSPFWSVVLFNNFDLNGFESNYAGDSSVTNAMAGKVSVSGKITPALSFYAAGVYATRLEKTATAKDEALGFEVDGLLFYAVNENVTLQGGFGYLVAEEDYYGKDFDDPWGATVHAIVKF